ncbi:MAG: ABC transporter ATP-binding protein [Flavobacteriales bacterium]|jgi:ATP-binding cassette subfamily B protein|nr:ABC transporter ATP-binding protein [Flavobacteriales bacterium]MBK6894115.1 ABC transporter ATP-binding protein [Flavobacteriales bacterium]MBK7248055.1 ABC transporter ATP-binding protein [Flavobacteriales bacterium]MBK9059757.1 ABC transporter ATP-binding protein [Flavobacteriales bacterium]MBK9598413.1 ABC transporter ATP-binding protein [Flavobacteriales bacterium]
MSGTKGKAFDVGLFRRVMQFVRPYRRLFWITFALTIFLSLVAVVRPVLMAKMVDNYAVKGDLNGLYMMMAIVVGLLVVEGIVQFYQGYWTSWLGQTITFDLRQQLFTKIVGFRMRYFDRTPIGTLVTRVISDIGTIESIFSQGLLSIMGDLLKLTVVVVVMFVYNWELALWSMVPIPLLLWATNIFKNAIQKSFQDVRTQVARLNAFVQEHIQGMAIVQLFGRERQEYRKFTAINKEHRGAHIRSVFAYSLFFPIVEILSAVSLAFLIWWGVGDVLKGVATFGELIAYIQFINMLYRPIRQLADRFNVLQMGMVGSERVFAVLDTEATMDESGTLSTAEVQGNIAFVDLWFAYIDEEYVLKNISFTAKAGQMIALVGATGSGKSSIVNVLSRAYEYQKGKVLLDGVNIRDYRLGELRKSVSVVLQDVFLFSDTVHNNITLHDDKISREEVIAAAKAVGAHDFIMQLPLGYDTDVRERGAILSVGQRQLLAFMRAFVNQPKVLVLDEATSSVDSMSEQLIQQATEKITQGRTSIVIAHRLSTIQKADRILVIGEGRIIEQGSHQELLAMNGAYRKLYDLQFA